MDSFTHIMAGIILYGLLGVPKDPNLLYLAAFFASLPDLDVFLSPLQKKYHSYFLSHRGASHSLVIGILISGISAGVLQIFMEYSFIFLWGLSGLFYSLHLGLDWLTMSKIPLFYPFSKKEYCIGIERSVNIYLMAVSFSFFIIFIFISLINYSYFAFPWIYTVFGVIYLLYLIHRLILKLVFATKLQDNQYFIPDLLPMGYSIYSRENESEAQRFQLKHFSLIKSKSLPEFDVKIQNNSLEQEIFSISFDRAKNYRFFRKWKALIPFIFPNDDYISVLLILAESLSRSHVYGYFITLEKKSLKIIEEGESFNLADLFLKQKNKKEKN